MTDLERFTDMLHDYGINFTESHEEDFICVYGNHEDQWASFWFVFNYDGSFKDD